MDRSGECQETVLEDLNINRELNLVGFTPQMFLEVGSSFVLCELVPRAWTG